MKTGRARRPSRVDASVELTTRVGPTGLTSPLLAASGTAGYGPELAAYLDLAAIGGVVVKSLSADPWPGNPAPRVHETPAGMINSVGLQGPGVTAWRNHELPALLATGATVVASIWGTSVAGYRRAAELLCGAPREVVAVEVNLSCPNVEARDGVFAHATTTTTAAVAAVAEVLDRPLWAKLSPNVTDLVAIARAAVDAGADALTLVNTVMGMVIDVEARRPLLGGGGGGVSGRAIHPVAVRAVWDVHAALPDVPLVGVGGVGRGIDAIELMLAGASAVQVGTATFADPRAIAHVQDEVVDWCAGRDIHHVTDIIGGAHD